MCADGAFAIGVILLISAPRISLGKLPSDVLAVVGLVASAALLSIEWYLYRVHKNGGYPYKLLL